MKFGSITTGIIADGLIFNMDPANRASYPKTGTVMTDVISNTTSGSFESGTVFSEDIAIALDGTDDYVQIGPNVSLTGTWSVSLWYKDTGAGSTSGYRNFLGGNTGLIAGFVLNNGVWKTYTGASPTWEPMSGNIVDGNWYNLTGVYDSAAFLWTSYVNGQFFNSHAANTNSNTTIGYQDFAASTLSKISRYPSSAQRYMIGSMGIVYAYNRALSANEVLHNYNALKGRYT
jgi:hypothetical protein